LIDTYLKYGNITIKVNWLNYEACEYYESASYKFLQEDLDGGNLEVDKGNEKTVERDELIEEMNKYASALQVLEEDI